MGAIIHGILPLFAQGMGELLDKLLQDEIQARRRKNILKYQSFKTRLEGALQRYHNNLISTAEIVQIMVDIRR